MMLDVFMADVKFGIWLSERMRAAGLNQNELAERARLSKQYISLLVGDRPSTSTGKTPIPRPDKIEKLARALNLPAKEVREAAYGKASDVEADDFSDDEIAFLASEYKELTELTPQQQRAELRAVIRMARTEIQRRLQEARAIKKQKK